MSPTSNKIKKSQTEIVEGLKEQIEILKSLCQIYDGGNKSISKIIAVTIRLLCNNTKFSKSLIHQSGLDQIAFVDTTPEFESENTVIKWGLIFVRLHSNLQIGQPFPIEGLKLWSDLSPKCGEGVHKVNFSYWWDEEAVFTDKFGNLFSRKILVREVADTDGGAHFDDSLNVDYFNIVKNNAMGLVYKQDGNNLILKVGIPGKDYLEEDDDSIADIENPIPACIRQIAYELILTCESVDFLQ